MSCQSAKENLVAFHHGSTYNIEFDGCCDVEMPNEGKKIHKEKSLKVPFIICSNLECLLSESKEIEVFLKIITSQ